MAIRLWEANRELERLVKLHSEILDEEIVETDREREREQRVLDAVAQPGSFLTLYDEFDSPPSTPTTPTTPIPCC